MPSSRRRSNSLEARRDAVRRVSEKYERPGGRKDLRWFRMDEPHETVFSLYSRISRNTSARRSQDLYYACLYEDTELAALFQGMQAQGEFTPQTMVSNVVKRQIDTYVARQAKNRPVPMAQPIDGRPSQQARAEMLTRFFSGVLDQVQYYETLSLRRRDRAIFGTGIAHNYRVGRKLFHERVFPSEIRVDPFEARYGCPRTLLRYRWLDRLVLAERFPEHEDAIMTDEFAPDDEPYTFARDETSDQVFVIEIWHLPNGEPTEHDAKDGAHAICISSRTLSHRVYKRTYFPFSVTRFSPGLAGWFGEGMASQLRGLQYEVNSVGLRLQEQGWMTGTYVWTPSDIGLEVDHLDNGTLTHIQSEVQPVFFTPAPWHPQFFDYYMFLRGRAPAEETRQSEMATRGELPAGLESGRAIRAWNKIDDQAFLNHGHEDERDAIDTCWQFFDLCEEIYEEEISARESGRHVEPFEVEAERNGFGRSIIQRLAYADVRMDRRDFKIRVFPTALLNGSPAEQYQTAKEMASDGLLSRDAILSLINVPDVQRVLRLETSPRRAVEKILERIMQSENPRQDYIYPEPAFNLELCRALALQTYLDGFTEGYPESNLRMVLQFALDAEEQIQRMNASAPEAAAPAGPDAGLVPDEMAAAGGMGPEMMGAGMQPTLFAEPQGPVMPEGAMSPEAIAPIPKV